MMDLRGIFNLVASLLVMLKKKYSYILLRLEFLVVVVTVLFLLMFVMEIFRRRIHSSIMRTIFSTFDGVSDSVVYYLYGAMLKAPFKNELFPVWILVLLIFQDSVGFIFHYGVPDPGGNRFMELRRGIASAALLRLIYKPRFQLPLWSLVAVQIVRGLYRLISHERAITGIWLGRSSELISGYMCEDQDDPGKWKPEECDPETMKGYKYLIYGESIEILQKPRSSVSPGSSSSGITLDKIWGCRKHLLRPGPDNIQGKVLKDLSLAFALSRLLRCRFEDVTLQDNIRRINRNLIKRRIVEEDHRRGLTIMEMQMAFVSDYFNTRYPVVFWSGLGSVFFSALQSLVTMTVVCWLSVDIHKVYVPPDDEVVHVVHGVNVDVVITWAFMLFLIFKEIWEMVTYLLSDWTKLLLLCMYADCGDEDDDDGHVIRNSCLERLMLSLSSSKISAKRWHGLLDQYMFLQSYDDKPNMWNLIHTVSIGLVPRKDDGAKLSSAIAIPEYVQTAVMEKLRALLDLDEPNPAESDQDRIPEPEPEPQQPPEEPVNPAESDQDRIPEPEPEPEPQQPPEEPVNPAESDQDRIPEPEPEPQQPPEEPVKTYGRRLPKVLTTLSHSSSGAGDRMELYGWACFNQQTSSHVILVWHIATNLCELALAKEQGVDLSKPGLLRSFMSCFTSACCSAKPSLVDVDEPIKENNHKDINLTGRCFTFKSNGKKGKKLTGGLSKRYIVANSLSKYCAYLLVSKPDLVPDSFLVPKMVFQETMRSARDDILKGCDSLQSRYDKLMEVAEAAVQNSSDVKGGNDAVRQGALLAKQLLGHENVESRWEILAGVWADLLVHMAPTWNAEAHRTYLESGGEFITNIWALLWHCNVEKSRLWPEFDAFEDDAPAAPPKDDGGGGGNTNTSPMMQETQQAGGADASDPHNGTEIHEEHDIYIFREPIHEPKAGN